VKELDITGAFLQSDLDGGPQISRSEDARVSCVARLGDSCPDLERLLTRGGEGTPPRFGLAQIRIEALYIPMRDGTRLATDIYLPPVQPAPVIAMRTPYLRGADRAVGALMAFSRRGYVVVSQDCRGTGESEPDRWDYYMFESDDGYDLVEWITQQVWFGGFIGSCGGSYVGQTQWPMATHPAMSTTVPHVSGLGIAFNTVHAHMYSNGYARIVGKGERRIEGVHATEIERLIEHETMASGYFNDPLHKPFSAALLARFPQLATMPPSPAKGWLWEHYCSLSCAERAEFVRQAMGTNSVSASEVEALSGVFGHHVSHDALTLPCPKPSELCRTIRAPPLLITSWYDWGLNDALATWDCLRRDGRPEVAKRTRLIITPHAHDDLGYREGIATHPELQIRPGIASQAGVVMRWCETVREGKTDEWPTVVYYVMGANEWRTAEEWPLTGAVERAFYLGPGGTLSTLSPQIASDADRYTYDPDAPTPTVGGSILSFLYPPGSVDVSRVQKRPDVLVYTTPPLERDFEVVGPLRMILYASSSATDTDFAARLSDVFPDGRAIQLQNCVLRARYREAEPALLEPGRIYRFEIDLWATANRFKQGHSLRVDISSADFPKFDRNSNRGGVPGEPIPAVQTIYHDPERPSHLLAQVLPSPESR
jgi:predicted acyl esterase